MTDIVVTYVDNQDPEWQAEYNKYKQLENIDESNEQTNSAIRFRDTGTFRYFFRSVEQNMPWVNNIFLIVQNERQVPHWINRDKVKVVYHKDYIPEDLLPTFNSNTIEFFLYRIPELANNWVLANDDTFALNPVPETMFFENDKVVYDKQPSGERPPVDMFNIMMRNNQNIIKQLTGIGDQWFIHRHQMVPHKKDLERQIIEPNLDVFKTCFKSKFRDYKNVTPWLFNELSKVANLGVNKPGLYDKSALIELNSKVDLNVYNNYELVCINDTNKNDNFELTKKRMQDFLYDKFPEPSKYELETSNADSSNELR